jgi:antitoxin PrlF
MIVRICETQKISIPETQDAVMTAETAVTTARIRGRGQLTLPTEVREALRVGEGDEVEFTRHDDGTVTVRGLKTIPADQAWFWSPDWQAGEREADEEIASGELSPVYGSAEEMFVDLGKRD